MEAKADAGRTSMFISGSKACKQNEADAAYEICEKGSRLLGINRGNDDESSNL